MAIESHLSEADAASIRGEFQRLNATIGVLSDHPVVTFVRQDGTEIGPVGCTSIRRDQARQDRAVGGGTGFSGTEDTGTLKAFAENFPQPVQTGDRFVWNGQNCRVTGGPAPKWYGAIVTVTFAIEQGN